MANNPTEPTDIIRGIGSFTPPPAPCGGAQCRYVGLDVEHGPDCEDC